ncbi:MAG: hypothetical protein DCC75_09735 [Proteobacteria bacterium]|nr:MAG: hypothetical protein DCC75_09735 [Pseudomonadota bacterium]
MDNLSKILAFLALFVSLASTVSAQVARVLADEKGHIFTHQVSPGQGVVDFYFISRGNITMPIYTYLAGPKGLRAEVRQKLLKGSVESALASEAGWMLTKLDRNLVVRAAAHSSDGEFERQAVGLCDFLSEATIQSLLAIMATYPQYAGSPPTRADLCGPSEGVSPGGNNPIPPSAGGGSGGGTDLPAEIPGSSVRAFGFLQKDTCNRQKRNARYLVRMRVELGGVSPEALASGFQVQAGFHAKPYKGGMRASIKPLGEGKYRQPLILMESVGGWGEEWVNLVTWAGGKIRSLVKVRKADNVYYRGMILARVPAGGVLRGGRKTFEMTNGTSVYSVCFNASPVRQRANGYPG